TGQLADLERRLGLQRQDRIAGRLRLQVGHQNLQRLQSLLEVGKGRTEEKSNRFGRRLPAFAPVINIGSDHRSLVGNVKGPEMFMNLSGAAEGALDENYRSCAAAEGFPANRSGAGEAT